MIVIVCSIVAIGVILMVYHCDLVEEFDDEYDEIINKKFNNHK